MSLSFLLCVSLFAAPVTLVWNSYTDQASITGFILERSTDTVSWSVVTSSIAVDAVTYEDDVAPGRYYWRLIATGPSGQSDPSNWTSKEVKLESPVGLGVEE